MKLTTLKSDFAPNINYRAERWYERAWKWFAGGVMYILYPALLALTLLMIVVFFEIVQ